MATVAPTQPSFMVSTNQYGEYWKTSALSFNILYFLAVIPFTGFFGIDHLYARSPKTAALKAFTNIFTLGWWYIYDVFQVIFRPDQVKIFGFSAPFFGPLGVGAGQFSGEGKDADKSYRFFIYALLVCLAPFGLDYFYIGNNFMGFVKLICTFSILLPIALLIGGWNIVKLFGLTGQVLDENHEFFGSEPSTKYKEYMAKSLDGGHNGWFGWLYAWLLSFLQSDLLLSIPVVGPFIQLATASLNTATIAVEAAGATIQTARDTAVNVIEATGETAKGVAAVASHASQIQQAFTPQGATLAIQEATKQAGGGNIMKMDFTGKLVAGVIALVIVSGGALAISRVIQNLRSAAVTQDVRSSESAGKKDNDRPPDAGSA